MAFKKPSPAEQQRIEESLAMEARWREDRLREPEAFKHALVEIVSNLAVGLSAGAMRTDPSERERSVNWIHLRLRGVQLDDPLYLDSVAPSDLASGFPLDAEAPLSEFRTEAMEKARVCVRDSIGKGGFSKEDLDKAEKGLHELRQDVKEALMRQGQGVSQEHPVEGALATICRAFENARSHAAIVEISELEKARKDMDFGKAQDTKTPASPPKARSARSEGLSL